MTYALRRASETSCSRAILVCDSAAASRLGERQREEAETPQQLSDPNGRMKELKTVVTTDLGSSVGGRSAGDSSAYCDESKGKTDRDFD
jgi:hypothetical protein